MVAIKMGSLFLSVGDMSVVLSQLLIRDCCIRIPSARTALTYVLIRLWKLVEHDCNELYGYKYLEKYTVIYLSRVFLMCFIF
jgi:hypothetical protein